MQELSQIYLVRVYGAANHCQSLPIVDLIVHSPSHLHHSLLTSSTFCESITTEMFLVSHLLETVNSDSLIHFTFLHTHSISIHLY